MNKRVLKLGGAETRRKIGSPDRDEVVGRPATQHISPRLRVSAFKAVSPDFPAVHWEQGPDFNSQSCSINSDR